MFGLRLLICFLYCVSRILVNFVLWLIIKFYIRFFQVLIFKLTKENVHLYHSQIPFEYSFFIDLSINLLHKKALIVFPENLESIETKGIDLVSRKFRVSRICKCTNYLASILYSYCTVSLWYTYNVQNIMKNVSFFSTCWWCWLHSPTVLLNYWNVFVYLAFY